MSHPRLLLHHHLPLSTVSQKHKHRHGGHSNQPIPPNLLPNPPPPKKVSRPSFDSSRFSCRKKGFHPKVYFDAKVHCKGQLVLTTGGTQKEYVTDVWSGNHPFYLGERAGLVDEVSQVEKFRQKFGEIKEIMEIPVLKGELVLPPMPKMGKKKK